MIYCAVVASGVDVSVGYGGGAGDGVSFGVVGRKDLRDVGGVELVEYIFASPAVNIAVCYCNCYAGTVGALGDKL